MSNYQGYANLQKDVPELVINLDRSFGIICCISPEGIAKQMECFGYSPRFDDLEAGDIEENSPEADSFRIEDLFDQYTDKHEYADVWQIINVLDHRYYVGEAELNGNNEYVAIACTDEATILYEIIWEKKPNINWDRPDEIRKVRG